MLEGGHFSQERLRADVNRAVGGTLNLVREMSRISHEMETSVLSEWLIKRAMFLSYELESLVSHIESPADRLDRLNGFFFEEKGFRCVHEPAKLRRPSDSLLFCKVLSHRHGSPLVLSFLYAFLAERIGIELDFVDFKPACFLRYSEKDSMGIVTKSQFIDVSKSGTRLKSDDVIEVLHSRFQTDICSSTLFEEFGFDTVLAHYVRELKAAIMGYDMPEQMLFLQNTLVAYQPSNLQLLAERAAMHRKLGHFKSALADLKRYFAFHDKEKASPDLVKLYNDLVRLLERHKAELD